MQNIVFHPHPHPSLFSTQTAKGRESQRRSAAVAVRLANTFMTAEIKATGLKSFITSALTEKIQTFLTTGIEH